jgi:hypothetical protein
MDHSVSLPRACVSVPPPWHTESAARRALGAWQEGLPMRAARLREALARPPAHNPVAVARLFAALTRALSPDIRPERLPGERHSALLALGLAPSRPSAANDNEELGVAVQRLFCVAGKKLDARAIVPALEVGRHALARFVERSGEAAPATLQRAVREAAQAADLLMAACAAPGAWLARGSAPVVMPAGRGAFLGFFRLLLTGTGGVRPMIEAHTLLHADDLSPAQDEVRQILSAGLPAAEALRHLPEYLARLRPNLGGDRRLAASLRVAVPGSEPSAELALRLRREENVLAARLALGLAGPDAVAAERSRG